MTLNRPIVALIFLPLVTPACGQEETESFCDGNVAVQPSFEEDPESGNCSLGFCNDPEVMGRTRQDCGELGLVCRRGSCVDPRPPARCEGEVLVIPEARQDAQGDWVDERIDCAESELSCQDGACVKTCDPVTFTPQCLFSERNPTRVSSCDPETGIEGFEDCECCIVFDGAPVCDACDGCIGPRRIDAVEDNVVTEFEDCGAQGLDCVDGQCGRR